MPLPLNSPQTYYKSRGCRVPQHVYTCTSCESVHLFGVFVFQLHCGTHCEHSWLCMGRGIECRWWLTWTYTNSVICIFRWWRPLAWGRYGTLDCSMLTQKASRPGWNSTRRWVSCLMTNNWWLLTCKHVVQHSSMSMYIYTLNNYIMVCQRSSLIWSCTNSLCVYNSCALQFCILYMACTSCTCVFYCCDGYL